MKSTWNIYVLAYCKHTYENQNWGMHWTQERARPTLCPDARCLSTSLKRIPNSLVVSLTKNRNVLVLSCQPQLQLDNFCHIGKTSLFSLMSSYIWPSQKQNSRIKTIRSSLSCLSETAAVAYSKSEINFKSLFMHLALQQLQGQWVAILLYFIKIKQIPTSAPSYF